MPEMSVINTFEMLVIHCPVFTVFLVVITSSKNIFITLILISRELPEHKGGCWRKKFPLTIL